MARNPNVVWLETLQSNNLCGYQARLDGTTSPGTTRYYSVNKYGPRKAKRLAEAFLSERKNRRLRRR